MTTTIDDLPEEFNPYWRMEHAGEGALSNTELLAIIAHRNGNMRQTIKEVGDVVMRAGGLRRLLAGRCEADSPLNDLKPQQRIRIRAAAELGMRLRIAAQEGEEKLQIRSPADVYSFIGLEMSLLEQEEMRIVLLDTKNNIIRVATAYRGSLNTAVVRIGEIFKAAIRENAANIIIVHNHPTGDPTPSPEDVQVTQMAVEAGKLLDIPVLDHVVAGRNRFVSMKERGLGFNGPPA